MQVKNFNEKNCKSRIASREWQKNLIDSFEQIFSLVLPNDTLSIAFESTAQCFRISQNKQTNKCPDQNAT
jgi:hypothetical protein